MSKYIDAKIVPALFDAEFKKTRELILQGETHLDNLAEGFLEADRVIRKIPAADVIEVRHGEWKKLYDKAPRYVCTACNHLYNNREYKFCPNCGAKMDGERRENGKS